MFKLPSLMNTMAKFNIHTKNLRAAIDKIHLLGDACWEELITLIASRKLAKNDHYSKHGETLKYLGFLVSGVLRAYYIDEEGKEWNEQLGVE